MKFEYNEHDVCLNPEIILETKGLCVEISESNGFWFYGYSITLENEGVGNPCMVLPLFGVGKDLAVKKALYEVKSWLRKRESKLAGKLLQHLGYKKQKQEVQYSLPLV